MDETFLISFPPSNSSPSSLSSISCNLPCWSPVVHVLPVHMLWFHGDKAPSLPKEDGQHKNALTDEGKSLQVPAKLGEVTPVESHILFGGNIPGSCIALDKPSLIFSMVSSFSSCLVETQGDEVFPCAKFVLQCCSWKSIRFLVRRWSISSLKQPRAASARWVTCGVASVVAISAMRWEKGLWVTGSIPMPESFFFSLVFQWFLTSLSVRPVSWAAINDHRLPTTEWSLTMVCSSASENWPCFRSGRR